MDEQLRCSLAPRVGLEPTTTRLTAECSTIELSRNILSYYIAKASKEFIFENFLNRYFLVPSKLHTVTFHLSEPTRSSLRPISIRQLHTLLHFHLGPIYLVVFKGSYRLIVGDILS